MAAGQTQFVLQHLRRAVQPPHEADDGALLEAFLLRRDEAAFATLLRRHGPMVWGVCRRFAGQPTDAEDAFQAVFLILVRRGERVWPRERVGAWLHGVAFRIARRARRLSERRRALEKHVSPLLHPAVEPSAPDGDLTRVIDEELRRLPERLRLPVLLCDVEGRPQREVARQLAVPVSTLGHRLATARRLLARRLTRRGVTLSLGALAAVVVPPSLQAVTRRAVLGLAAGRELAALVPAQIIALTEGALTMSRTKIRLAAALVLTILLGGLGLNALERPGLLAGENDPPRPAAGTRAEPPIDDRTFLRRISMDLRGMLPTEVEMNYFVADTDNAKRRKVVGWMLHETPGAAEKWKTRGDFPTQDARALYEQALKDALSAQTGDQVKSDVAFKLLRRAAADAQAEQPSSPKPASAQADETKRALKLLEGYLQSQKPGEAPVPEMTEEARRLKQWIESMGNPSNPADPDAIKRQQRAIERGIEFLKKMKSTEPEAVPPMKPDGRASDMALLEQLDRQLRLLADRQKAGAPEKDDRSTDAEFLRRLTLDLTGAPPTLVEMNYFLADKDPNKRQKVSGWLSKTAEAGRQLELWKRALVGAKLARSDPQQDGDRFNTLLGELLASSRTDDQVLEAICLATLARLPTESERALLIAYLRDRRDRQAAWESVLHLLLNTQEFRRHAAAMAFRAVGSK